jgi:modulator of FtsH protease HflK
MAESHEHHEHQHRRPAAAKKQAAENDVQDVSSRALSEALSSSFFFVKIVMVILVIIFLGSGMVIVGPQERAVVLRLGKVRGQGAAQLMGPGLHFAFPPPIDEVVRIPIGEIQTTISSVGWYATPQQEAAGSTLPPPMPSLNPAFDGYTLTGDGNIVHARAILGYRVTDPLEYVFDFVNASNVVQTTLDNALVWACSQMTVDDAIKNNDVIREKVTSQFTRLAENANLGVTVDTMTVTVVPPRYVKSAFDAVTTAQQDQDAAISAAQGEANKILANARAESNAVVNAGISSSSAYLKEVKALAKSFSEQLPEYKKNPELFQQRLLAETWQPILANAESKTIIPDRANGKPYELRVLLRQVEQSRTNAPSRTP